MWSIVGLFTGILLYGIYRYYMDKRDGARDVDDHDGQQGTNMTVTKEQNGMEQQGQPRTRELAFKVLKEIGCQPNETEEGRIRFDYQGITFLMDVTDDCLFVNLIWPWCHTCSLYDIDEFARVRKAVNKMNANSTCSVFYVPNPESDEVAVHIKKHFIIVPQIPHLDQYLCAILRGFFITARELDMEIENVRVQENVKQQL